MGCFWKTSAACSCAFRLAGTAEEIFGELAGFGSGTIVLREQGLSLSHRSAFGRGVVAGGAWWDAVSGLQALRGAEREIHLLTDASDPRPLLVSAEPGRAADLSIRLDGQVWGSPRVRELIQRYRGLPVGCERSRSLGAGAWLDEWESDGPRDGRDCEKAGAVRERLQGCPWLEVEVSNSGHHELVAFSPEFIDLDGSVLRIADRCRAHVVFADAERPGLRLAERPGSRLRLSREPRAA